MRGWRLAAFPLALPFLTWACDGESRPDFARAARTFDDPVCEHLPSDGF